MRTVIALLLVAAWIAPFLTWAANSGLPLTADFSKDSLADARRTTVGWLTAEIHTQHCTLRAIPRCLRLVMGDNVHE